jgi:hypothetical protein
VLYLTFDLGVRIVAATAGWKSKLIKGKLLEWLPVVYEWPDMNRSFGIACHFYEPARNYVLAGFLNWRFSAQDAESFQIFGHLQFVPLRGSPFFAPFAPPAPCREGGRG